MRLQFVHCEILRYAQNDDKFAQCEILRSAQDDEGMVEKFWAKKISQKVADFEGGVRRKNGLEFLDYLTLEEYIMG